jgi:hypothetical protein
VEFDPPARDLLNAETGEPTSGHGAAKKTNKNKANEKEAFLWFS